MKSKQCFLLVGDAPAFLPAFTSLDDLGVAHRNQGLTMRLFLLTCAMLFSCATSTFAEPIAVADLKRTSPVSFDQEILPIFRRSCLACHSSSEASGELILETPAKIRNGGDSGAALVPGKGAESLLLKLAAHQEESFMPPPDNDVNAPALTSQELGLVRLWIDQGAKGQASNTPATPTQWKSIPKSLGPVYAAVLSPDGRLVAAARANRLFIYDIGSGELVGTLEDSSLDTPAAHRDLVQSIAWGGDGALLASGGFREAKLWEKPRDARAISFPTKTSTKALAVSPDRKWLATAGNDHGIQLWNIGNDKHGPKLIGHENEITSIQFSSDGKQLFSASLDKTIRIWNCREANQVGLVQVPTPVHAIELIPAQADTDESPNYSQTLVAGGDDKVVRVWSIKPDVSAEEWSAIEPLELSGHTETITSVAAVEEQPRRAYSASRDGTIRYWDLDNQKQLGKFSHGASVLDVAVRSDGKRIVSVGENGTAKLWDQDGKLIAEMKGDPHLQQHAQRTKDSLAAAQQRLNIVQKRLTSVEEVLANRSTDKNTADMEVTEAAEALVEKKTALEELIKKQAAAEPAITVDSEKEEKTDNADVVKEKEAALNALQDAEAAQQLAVKKQTAAIAAVKVAEESVTKIKQLVDRATANVKEAQASVEVAQKQASESALPLRSVSFSLDGSKVATAGDFPSVQVWEADTGRALGAVAKQSEPLYPLVFLDNNQIVSTLGATDVVVWDLNPAWRLRQTIGSAENGELITGRVTSLDIDAEDSMLLVGSGVPSRNGELALFHLEDGARTHHLPEAHADVVYAAQFSPDGTQFISGGADKYVKLWDRNSQTAVKQFEGHSDYVLGVSWKSDATSIATGSSDQTVKIWDVETADQSRAIAGFGKDVTSVRFVGSTNHVISSSGDGTARLQDAASGKSVRTFQAGTWLHCVDATSDEKIIIAGGDDGRLFVWDGTNGKQLKVISVGD